MATYTRLYTLRFTLHTALSTLYTLHFTLYTLPSTHHTLNATRYTPHSLLHTLHSHSILYTHTLHFTHSTYTLPSTHHTLYVTRYTPHSLLHTLHSTLHTLHSTLYTSHSTLHTLHFTLYTLRSTLYTLHFTLYTYTPHSTLETLHLTLYTPRPYTLQPAGSFASQQLPKRASLHIACPRPKEPAQATLLSLQSSPHRTPRPELQSVPFVFFLPFPLFFHYSFQVFPLFCYALIPFLHPFTLHSTHLQMHVRRTDLGGIEPRRHPMPPGTSASKSTTVATLIRWGSASKSSVWRRPPPRPPILTSFAMSNFAMLDSWLS